LLWNNILPLFADDTLLIPTNSTEFRHKELRWETGDQAIWNTFFFDKQYKGEIPAGWPFFGGGKAFFREGLVERNE